MKPNFFVLGAAKAGSSSLYHYLSQHPQIYMSPQEELNYFAHAGRDLNFRGPFDRRELRGSLVRTMSEYEAQFAAVNGEAAIGEVSPHYLYSEQAPERIRCHAPDAKLIAVLRQPVDRAFSAFTHMLRDGREETTDFQEALRREEARIQANWEPLWHYAAMGFYAQQLKRYFACFDASQIRIYTYEDYVARPLEVLQDIFRFLGVEPDFEPDLSDRHNVSLVPQNWRLHKLMTANSWWKDAARAALPAQLRLPLRNAVLRRNLRPPTRLDKKLRRELSVRFRDDILELRSMLGLDLSGWLD